MTLPIEVRFKGEPGIGKNNCLKGKKFVRLINATLNFTLL